MTINTDVPQEITVRAEPLDLFTKKKTFEERMRYQLLKRVYTILSDRHKDMLRDAGDPVPEGPCTEMNGVNFSKPVAPLDESAPFPIDSVTNRFGTFVLNMLRACESGSIGGDACRMQLVLEAAIEDIWSFNFQGVIEHLLGLTMAIVQHGLWAFLDRGDPESGQRLFKEMAREWKKFFDRHPVVYNLSEDFQNFARGYGEAMQKMLKSTRQSHGAYATTYNFNFIRIPRKRKSSSEKENANPTESSSSKRKKKKPPTEMELLMERVNAVEGVSSDVIYDSCPEVRSKIRAFLGRDGVTKRALCQALGDMNHNSLNQFLAAKGQKRAGTVAYTRAYVFFEKLRILEGEPKSLARLRNEAEMPAGFSFERGKGGRPPTIFYDPGLAQLIAMRSGESF